MQIFSNAFDSRHYGINIGRLVPDEVDGADELAAGLESARAQRFDVVFLRLRDDHPLCKVMKQAGLEPVDTLITSTLVPHRHHPREGKPARIEHLTRADEPMDIEAIAQITATSIRTSHLHADPRLAPDRTRALYGAWARNDVTGRAQHLILARMGSRVVGYVAVLATEGTAIIDLIAVDSEVQGKGIGRALLDEFVAWIGTRNLVATVGTQADNPALRLYARCGFVASARHFTYHFWLAEP